MACATNFRFAHVPCRPFFQSNASSFHPSIQVASPIPRVKVSLDSLKLSVYLIIGPQGRYTHSKVKLSLDVHPNHPCLIFRGGGIPSKKGVKATKEQGKEEWLHIKFEIIRRKKIGETSPEKAWERSLAIRRTESVEVSPIDREWGIGSDEAVAGETRGGFGMKSIDDREGKAKGRRVGSTQTERKES